MRMIRQFFLGFIRIHILYHASREPVCGVDMTKELERHGYSVSPGLMYPTLRSLEVQGYLVSEKKIVEGRMRKYYRTTSKGESMLEESKKKINELIQEVMC